jgi:hypothetical protein
MLTLSKPSFGWIIFVDIYVVIIYPAGHEMVNWQCEQRIELSLLLSNIFHGMNRFI